MTLLSICTDALNEIGGVEVPTTIAGNTDEIAERSLALVNRTGKELARNFRFNELLIEKTFTTVASQASYSLATDLSITDFQKFALETQWDRSNNWLLRGPATPSEWQYFQSGINPATVRSWYRKRGDAIEIYPTPSGTDTLAFEYYSSHWCRATGGGSTKAAFTADNDVGRLDEDLLTLGLKWRFLHAIGEPYDEAKAEFYDTAAELQGHSKGAVTVNMTGRLAPRFQSDSIPDTGYGT